MSPSVWLAGVEPGVFCLARWTFQKTSHCVFSVAVAATRATSWTESLPASFPVRSCLCLALSGLVVILGGCAVGPDFAKPAAPQVAQYEHTPLVATVATPDVAGGGAQRMVRGGKVAGQWWQLFRSPALNALEDRALARSPTLAAAQAVLRSAHEQMLAGRGAYAPSVGVGVSGSRNRDSSVLGSALSNDAYLYNLFTPELDIGYAPDVFGLERRQVESLQAREQAARFAAIATYNTLTTNVVVATIEVASLQAQVQATEKLVKLNRGVLHTLQQRQAGGFASGMDVAAQRSQLAQLQASLPALRKQWAVARHGLAVLCGDFPGQLAASVPALVDLALPSTLPLSLPSQLVAQRPDVRQAQADWHAASAGVGVADAERLPHIELSADAGSTALKIAHVFTSGTGFWNLAAGITVPLFAGGALRHQSRAAKADSAAAAAQYRQTVLVAFEDVADTLSAIDQDAKALQAAVAAQRAAKVLLDATQRRVRDGYADGIALAQAGQDWQQARIGLIQARAHRFADTAALFQALGGGWQQRPPSSTPQS